MGAHPVGRSRLFLKVMAGTIWSSGQRMTLLMPWSNICGCISHCHTSCLPSSISQGRGPGWPTLRFQDWTVMGGGETATFHRYMVSQMIPRLSTRFQPAHLVHIDCIAELGEEAVIQRWSSLMLSKGLLLGAQSRMQYKIRRN